FIMFDKNGRCEVVDSPGFAKDLVENFRWLMDAFSGKTNDEDRKRVIYTMVETAQYGYRKIVSALLYGILTEDDYSKILWLITIIIDDNRETTVNAQPGLYEVIENLLRQIREVSNIPDFAAIYSNLDHNAKLLMIRKPTMDYCLSSRLTNDEKARITAYLENHTPKAFPRKFDTFFRDFSVSGYTLLDIIRWICSAFRSAKPNAEYQRHQLISAMIAHARDKENSSEAKQSIMLLSKTALILDWLSFDRNSINQNINDNIINIEPTVRLILESYRTDSQFGPELIEYLGSSISNFLPGFDPEIRENVRVAAQTVIRRNVMTIEELNMIRSKTNDGRAASRIILEIWGGNKQLSQQSFQQQSPSLPPRQQLTPLNQTAGALYNRPLNQTGSTSNSDQQNSRRTSVNYDSLPMQSNPLVQPTQQDLPVSVPRQQIPPTSALKPSDQRTTIDNPKKLRMWLYLSALPNFEKAIQNNYIDESLEHLKNIFEIFLKNVDLGFPNSPHFKELPEKLAAPLCNSINFDELKDCYDLSNRLLKIEPSGRNLFNLLLSWIFQWKTEPNDNNSNKYKAFELLRLIINCAKQTDGSNEIHAKARSKLMMYCLGRSQSSGLHDTSSVLLDTMGSININLPDAIELYTAYLKFEITREKISSNVEEEFKQRWLEDLTLLQENENSVFLSMVPQLLKFWPNIFVGTPRFIYMIASGIYKFETDLRQQKYKVIGDVEGVDSILACALEWDSFEQIYLFNLIGSEYGNDVNQTEKFMSTSVYLKSLDPLTHPEALSGLIWLLETVSPTVKIIEALFEIMISTTTEARMFFDNLKIEGSTNKTADLIRAIVDLMDDLWKKSYPALKHGFQKLKLLQFSIGIQIKFSNLVEEISDDKHMEFEEMMFWCISNIKTIEGSPVTFYDHNSANKPTTTSTSDGEENEEETTLPPVLPTKRIKRKIIKMPMNQIMKMPDELDYKNELELDPVTISPKKPKPKVERQDC
ncbi:420_t:CDS:10, partial [Dentiscutata erythropus]